MHGPHHPTFDEWMIENGREIDVVLLSRPDVAAALLPAVRAHTQARVVYYGHDLHFKRLRMQAKLLRDPGLLLDANRMEQRERAIWRAVDVSLYPSDHEAEQVRVMAHGVSADAIVPYCFPQFGSERPPPSGKQVLFVGGFGHPPNEDAACWFANQVWPIVQARVPHACLMIVGSKPTSRVLALTRQGITVEANVPDEVLARRYAQARVAAVPLRYGAGVKLKVVEALKEGVPLVTTPVGAQGLYGLEEVAAVCEDAELFATHTCSLLTDDTLWRERCRAQLVYARARFGEAALLNSLVRGISVRAYSPETTNAKAQFETFMPAA
jgi:glycosyltransferase involved in cell wall biosynthesis